MANRLMFGVVFLSVFLIVLCFGCGSDSKSTIPQNSAPVISSVVAAPDSIMMTFTEYLFPDSLELTCIATDADEDSISYLWSTAVGTWSGTGAVVTLSIDTLDSISIGSHTVFVEVSDGRGGSAIDSTTFEVYWQGCAELPIDSLVAVPDTIRITESSVITCYVHDENIHSFFYYTWYTPTGTYTYAGISTLNWTAPEEPGDYHISCFVTDAMGSGNRDSVLVVVEPNGDPEVTSLTADSRVLKPGDVAHLSAVVSDPEDDELTISWTTSGGTLSGSGESIDWTAPAQDGNYSVTLTVTDELGGVTVQSIHFCSLSGTFLARSNDGLIAVDANANNFVFYETNKEVELLGTRIFILSSTGVWEIGHDGNRMDSVEFGDGVSGSLALLPDGAFVSMNSSLDLIYFSTPTGELYQTVATRDEADNLLQSLDGIVVDNQLIIAEDGDKGIIAIDLTTYERSLFYQAESASYISSIDYSDGVFYIGRNNKVEKFIPGGPLELLGYSGDENVTGIVVVHGFVFLVANFDSAIGWIDIASGEYGRLISDLNYPRDIEYIDLQLSE